MGSVHDLKETGCGVRLWLAYRSGIDRIVFVNSVSLFSSGGIGDIAFADLGVRTLVSNELLADRHEVFQYNFPDTKCITGDIWKLQNEIISSAKSELHNEKLDFILATPPCQGMSKNGRGKLLSKIRKGERPALDPRNQLIIPTVNIIKKLPYN